MTGRAFALAMLAVSEVASAAAPKAMLEPSSKWLLDYAPDSCLLARQFGQGDEAVLVQFVRYEPEDRFALNLIGRTFRGVADQGSIQLRFGATGPFVRTAVQAGKAQFATERLPAIFLSGRLDNLDTADPAIKARMRDLESDELARSYPVSPATEAAVTSLAVRVDGRTVALDLGSMGPPMMAMRRCTDDLVKQWGFDPAEQAHLASHPRPVGDPGRWLQGGDYPSAALADGEQALIFFRLAVGPDGAVSGCSIQSSLAKDSDFAQKTCELIKRRARFEPARTAEGRAVASYYVNKVRWIIRRPN